MERNDVIQIRVSPQEKAQIRKRADGLQMNLSDFLRMRALDPAMSLAEAYRDENLAPATVLPPQQPFVDSRGRVHQKTLRHCPVKDCDFEAGSIAATCPIHNKRVV